MHGQICFGLLARCECGSLHSCPCVSRHLQLSLFVRRAFRASGAAQSFTGVLAEPRCGVHQGQRVRADVGVYPSVLCSRPKPNVHGHRAWNAAV